VIVEIALTVGLAAVLSVWKVTLPWNIAGGSISLAMLPLFVLALRRGVAAGMVAGLLYGAADYVMEPFFVHPAQVFLDYAVAFAVCGLAGLGSRSVNAVAVDEPRWRLPALVVAWTCVGALARFAASVASGVVFFGTNAPTGQPALVYSLVYNASYLAPTVVVTAALAAVVVPALVRSVPVGARPAVKGQG
jgi:thiamine transporter